MELLYTLFFIIITILFSIPILINFNIINNINVNNKYWLSYIGVLFGTLAISPLF